MNRKNRTLSLSTLTFYSAYGLFISLVFLSRTFYFQYIMGIPYQIGLWISVLILFIHEISIKRYTKKALYGLVICLVLSALLFIADVSNRNVLILTFLMIYIGRNEKFCDIGSFTFKILSVLFIVIVLSSLAGIIPNYTTFSGGRTRKYIGFLYSLTPTAIICNLTMLVIVINKERIKWKELLVLFIINCFVYSQTKSRLGFLVALLIIVVASVKKIKPKQQMAIWKRRLFATTPVICSILSLTVAAMYNGNNGYFRMLNILLDGRLSMAHEAMTKYGMSLFGTHFAMIGNGLDAFGNNTSRTFLTYFYIDNLYVQLLVRNGIVFFLIFMALYVIAIHKAAEYDPSGYYCIALSILALESIIQDSFFSLTSNTFLFVIGTILMNQASIIQENRGIRQKRRRNISQSLDLSEAESTNVN
jgi:hypothetical protein